MVVATMENKAEQSTTLLVEKKDFEKLQEDVQKLKKACVKLKRNVDLLNADFGWTQEKYIEYDSSTLCRMIIGIKRFFKRVGAWFAETFKSDEEDDYE